MTMLVGRVGAAYLILATVTGTIATVGGTPAQAIRIGHAKSAEAPAAAPAAPVVDQTAGECLAINTEMASLSTRPSQTDEAAAKRAVRKRSMFGVLRTVASYTPMFAGASQIGQIASMAGQVAAQSAAQHASAPNPATTAATMPADQRRAQLTAMAAARGCTPA